MILGLAVWGKDYCKTYLDYVLPSHLASGNADHFADEDQYFVFTDKKSKKYLLKSKKVKKLCSLIKVKWIVTRKKKLAWSDMTRFHCSLIKAGIKYNQGCIFLGADFIISSGAIKKIKELANQGYKLILAPGIRTSFENIGNKLKKYIKGNQLNIKNEKLAKICITNLHNITKCQNISSKNFTTWPSAIYQKNEVSKNLTIQSLHIHPIYAKIETHIKQQIDSIDGKLLQSFSKYKQYIYIVKSSDELMLLELSKKNKHLAEPDHMHYYSYNNLIKFMAEHTLSIHRYIFKTPYFLLAGKNSEKCPPIKFEFAGFCFFYFEKLKKLIISAHKMIITYLHQEILRIILLFTKFTKICQAHLNKYTSNLKYYSIYKEEKITDSSNHFNHCISKIVGLVAIYVILIKKILLKLNGFAQALVTLLTPKTTYKISKKVSPNIDYIIDKKFSFWCFAETITARKRVIFQAGHTILVKKNRKKPFLTFSNNLPFLQKKVRKLNYSRIRKISIICIKHNKSVEPILCKLLYFIFKRLIFSEKVIVFKAKRFNFCVFENFIKKLRHQHIVGLKVVFD